MGSGAGLLQFLRAAVLNEGRFGINTFLKESNGFFNAKIPTNPPNTAKSGL